MTDLYLPPIEAVIDLHSEWIEAFGGASGTRDRGALESPLGRATRIHTYEPDSDVIAAAAAVCVSICRNHPFVDGNKRAAFGILGVILGMNGFYLDVSEGDASTTILALAAGNMPEEKFRAWVRANTQTSEDC